MSRKNSFHLDAVFEKIEEFFEFLGEKIENCMENLEDSKTFQTVTSTVDEVATDLTRVTKKMIKRIIK